MTFNYKYKKLEKINPISEILQVPRPHNNPFKLYWLNSAHLETLLPNSPWRNIYEKIIQEFCNKTERKFESDTTKQIIFSLLGNGFVSKYFPNEKLDSTLIKPPLVSIEDSLKLFDKYEIILNQILDEVLKEKQIYNEDDLKMSAEVGDYADKAKEIFNNHFCRQLSLRESEYYKSISILERNFRPNSLPLNHKPTTAISSVYDENLPNQVADIYPYGPEMLLASSPRCISIQSEFTGESIASLANQHQISVDRISRNMIGRRLPISLKKLIWKHVLFNDQNTAVTAELVNFEQIAKEKFIRAVNRGVTELKINHEMKTPVNELLENLIIEIYEKSKSLQKLSCDYPYLNEAVKILNILYAYDRSYQPYLVYWLFPFHYGLKSDGDNLPVNKIDFNYEVALCLHMSLGIINNLWNDIGTIVTDILSKLKEQDTDFYNHLITIAKIQVTSQTKEFLAQLFDDKFRSNSNLITVKHVPSSIQVKENDILNSPVIFIRKWIGEAFVSTMRNEAVIFVFDQLFMMNLSNEAYQLTCLSLLLLLRPVFMKCTNHTEMKQVFLERPAELLTVDIIRAWNWLYKQQDFKIVPSFNRIHSTKKDSIKSPTPKLPVKQPSFKWTSILTPPISFKDIHVILCLPISYEKQLKESELLVSISLLLGNREITQCATKKIPKLKEHINIQDKSQFIWSFEQDILEFKELDLSIAKNQYTFGDRIQFLIMVQQTINNSNSAKSNDLMIGWCLIDGYNESHDTQHESNWQTEFNLQEDESKSQFDNLKRYVLRLSVDEFNTEIPLTNNIINQSAFKQRKMSQADFKYPILTGSVINFTCFNPLNKKPETPKPKILTTEPVKTVGNKPKAKETKSPENVIKGQDWIPFDASAFAKIKPAITSRVESFCVYIDQIRFVPDNATIIKVTGRFLQTDHDSDIPDVLIVPDVESEPRSPTFRPNWRVVVNKNRKMLLSRSSLLILRVYTVLRNNLQLVVIGNCLIPLFDKEQDILLAGCYQRRLKNQLPNFGLVDANKLNESSLKDAAYIDGVSITYRLWPFTEHPEPAPDYKSGVYESNECQPSDFELTLFDLYNKDDWFSMDYRDLVREIKFRDSDPEFKDKAVTHSFMMNYIPNRLDVLKYLPENQAPKHISRELMFHYRLDMGIHFKIKRIYALNVDQLVFVTTKVFRGPSTFNQEPRPNKSYGLDEFYITSNVDLSSPVRSQMWNDEYIKIHPYFDQKSLLVIQVWQVTESLKLDGIYNTQTQEKITKLSREHCIGWTSLEIMPHGFINSGQHQLPLFQNPLHVAILKKFQNIGVTNVLQKDEEFVYFDSNSIIVDILDGHKEIVDYGSELERYSVMIDSMQADRNGYVSTQEASSSGRTMSQHIDEITSQGQSEITVSNVQSVLKSVAEDLVTASTAKQPYLPIILL